MFTNYRIIKTRDYVDLKNKGDCIAVYDVDTLGEQKELFIKALNSRHLNYRYFNGNNTDKLFIGVELPTFKKKETFLKMLKKFKGHGLTKAERKELYSIRKGYYLSKKYLDTEISDAEYGLYEPISQYSDYWSNKDCSEWETMGARIEYDKKLFWEVFPQFSSYKRMMYGEK